MELEGLAAAAAYEDGNQTKRLQKAAAAENQQPELCELGQHALEHYDVYVLADLCGFIEDCCGEQEVSPNLEMAAAGSLPEVIRAQKRVAPSVKVVLERGRVTKAWGSVDVVATIGFDAMFTGLTMREALTRQHAGGPRFFVEAHMVNTTGENVGRLKYEDYPINPDVTPEPRSNRIRLRSLAATMPGRRGVDVIGAAQVYVQRQIELVGETLNLLWASASNPALNPELAAHLAS